MFLHCSNIYTEIREYKVRTCPEIFVEFSFTIVFFFLCLAELGLVIFQEGSACGSPKTINTALWGGLHPGPYLVIVKWQPMAAPIRQMLGWTDLRQFLRFQHATPWIWWW